jgi:hypothetical protein
MQVVCPAVIIVVVEIFEIMMPGNFYQQENDFDTAVIKKISKEK